MKRYRAYMEHMFRYIRRSKMKSVLSVLIVMAFTVSIGWLNKAIERNIEETELLYNTTLIDFIITYRGVPPQESMLDPLTMDRIPIHNFIDYATINQIMQTGNIKESQLQASFDKFNAAQSKVTINSYNYIEPFVPGTHQKYEAAFMDGWDINMFTDDWPFNRLENGRYPVLVNSRYMEMNNLSIGDVMYIFDYRANVIWFEQFAELHGMAFDEMADLLFNNRLPVRYAWFMEDFDIEPDSEIMDLYSYFISDVERLYNRVFDMTKASNTANTFIIVGQYYDLTGQSYDMLLPQSAIFTMESRTNSTGGVRYARFIVDPSVNREFHNVRDQIDSIVIRTGAGIGHRTVLRAIYFDGELYQVVEPLERTLRLMQVLYPVIVVISVLIAAGFSFLMMLQSAKEAAIMRVLGSKKGVVRLMHCLEQVILCIAGLVFGFAMLPFLPGSGISVIYEEATLLNASLYFGGLLIGAICGAIPVTNRTPLEMLQVKE